jgi:hypothetical protein
MQINPSLQPVPVSTPTAPQVGRAGAWQVGQVLQALVLTPTQGGRVNLEVTGARLAAETNLALRQGQLLTVQVARTGNPTVLRLTHGAASDAVLQAEVLRTALPRQAPLEPLLANLAHLTRGGGAGGERLLAELPPQTAQAVRNLAGAMRAPGELATAEGLRAAVRESGTFLEALLGRGHPPPARDLKTLLLRLAGSLPRGSGSTAAQASGAGAAQGGKGGGGTAPPAPPPASQSSAESPPPLRGAGPRPGVPAGASLALGQPGAEAAARTLEGQVEGALARIQLGQLASLPGDDGRQAWLAELPVRTEDGADLWRLKLGPEDGGGAEAGAAGAWSAELAFNLPGLGPMVARVSLRGTTVSTMFWSEAPATAGIVGRSLPDLEGLLEAAGLEVGRLQSHAGLPPPAPATPLPPLLDVQA